MSPTAKAGGQGLGVGCDLHAAPQGRGPGYPRTSQVRGKAAEGQGADRLPSCLVYEEPHDAGQIRQETDMGAGFLEKGSTQDPHLHYGAADFQTVKIGNIELPVYKAGISQVRRSKAREYNTILAKQRERNSLSNEIIVAYRQNASPRFPIIGIPVNAGAWYEVQDNQKDYYRDAAIMNSWRETVELNV
jgi:hypothetical protein